MRKLIDTQGFTFIVPMTLAIVVGFAIMAIGGYCIGTIDSTLEETYPTNTNATGGTGAGTDWRTPNQNKTIDLLGNVTGGFGDVIDIEIVVIIITALSMAIFAIMAVGSRRGMI